jgi:hypothetical protein
VVLRWEQARWADYEGRTGWTPPACACTTKARPDPITIPESQQPGRVLQDRTRRLQVQVDRTGEMDETWFVECFWPARLE